MAKGRKLTTSQSERFLGTYGYGNGNVNVHGYDESSEIGEEDVWSMVDDLAISGDREDDGDDDDRIASNSSRSEWTPRAPVGNGNNNIPIMRRRGRGGEERHLGGLSLAFESSEKTASSPRILHQFHYGREGVGQSPRGAHHMATSAPVNVPDWSKIYRVDSVESLQDSDGGLEDQSEMVPPHEYLARSRRTGTTSVFEGVGRTLKGRDLRRVRDAVWSQTGFDG